MKKKNVAMSVRARLLNIRNSEPGTEYMQVLLRYIQERMLYRLSMSQYRDNFCLKGSALIFAYEKFKNDPIKQTQWKAFLKKMKHKEDLPLNEVVDYITETKSPYWLSLKK
jgi:hypothetical protein